MCSHPSVTKFDCFDICDVCGLETLDVDSGGTHEFSGSCALSLGTESFSELIVDIPEEMRKGIVEMYESLMTTFACGQVLRGDKKKAVFAALYFFTRQRNKMVCLPKDVIMRFSLDNKSFNEGSKIVFAAFPVFRAITNNVVSFFEYFISRASVPPVFTQSELFMIQLKLKHVVPLKKLNNLQPQHVCACVILSVLLASPTDKKFKRAPFLRDIGLSDINIRKINQILTPELIKLQQKHNVAARVITKAFRMWQQSCRTKRKQIIRTQSIQI